MDYELHKQSSKTSFTLCKIHFKFYSFLENCQEAAKNFSYIVLYFENPEILNEIKEIINSLKKADRNELLDVNDNFNVEMFKYFANNIQQKIVMMLTADDSTDFAYIRIMKKFSRNFNLALHIPVSYYI